jgi:hypothetical protein
MFLKAMRQAVGCEGFPKAATEHESEGAALRSCVVDHLPPLLFEKVARILFPVHVIHNHLPQNVSDYLPQMSVDHSENV